MRETADEIGVGSLGDVPAFIELLEEAGTWLWERGIRQWEPGSSRQQEAMIRGEIDAGALLLARSTSGILGGCVVTTSPDPIWPGDGLDAEGAMGAVYLHKLAVARSASGRRLGARLVSMAEAWVLSAQRPCLRLDCWDQNATLRAYYRDLGFEELDSVPSEGTFVRLFEKRFGR